MARIKTLHQAFLHELSDTYDAEQQLTQAMREMMEMTQNARVKKGLQQHLRETEQQIKNLDRVFKSLGAEPEKMTCKGIAGIIAEFKSGAKEIKEPELLNGFILGGGCKGEHYEIATYRGLLSKATLMGHQEAAQLLQQNLRQEERFLQECEQLEQQLSQQMVSQRPELVGHKVLSSHPESGQASMGAGR